MMEFPSNLKTPLVIFSVIIFTSFFINGCSIIEKKDPEQELKNKAGRINDLIIYKRYDDLFAVMSESFKLKLSQQLFNSVDSTIKSMLGRYVKPIDTTISVINGVALLTVRNQYQQGITTTSVQFDDEGKILHLYTVPTRN